MYLRPLRLGANVLFRHPSPVPSAERAVLGAARDGSGERGALRCTFPLSSPRVGAEGRQDGRQL